MPLTIRIYLMDLQIPLITGAGPSRYALADPQPPLTIIKGGNAES